MGDMLKINLPPNGCRKHPDCYSCPFPDCRFEHGSEQRRKLNKRIWYAKKQKEAAQIGKPVSSLLRT